MKAILRLPRHLKTLAAMACLAATLLACGKDAGGATNRTASPTESPVAASPAATSPAATSPAATSPAASGTQPAATEGSPPASPSATAVAAPEAAPETAPEAVPASAAPGALDASRAAAKPRRLGELVFAEGAVSMHRAGSEPRRADIGDTVRAYDVIVTGPKSRAEVDLGSGTAGGASVKLSENTAFYFDSKELDDAARKTVLQLLSGAVAVKVDRLAGGSFRIATDNAVLGVRGTVFIVDTVPDGSLLVTCDSGAVAVSVDGAVTTAKPGGVVELTDSGGLRLLAVEPGALASYRGDWRKDAYRAFSPRALSVASGYAAAIDEGRPAFAAALARLEAQAPALAAWREARDAGREPRFTDWIAEKKAVSAALFDCLKALFAVERPYYRLLELRVLHEGGIGVGALKDGRSSAAYYAAFDASTRDLAAGMAKVREALGLFSWAAAGSPLGELFGSKAEGLGTGAILTED